MILKMMIEDRYKLNLTGKQKSMLEGLLYSKKKCYEWFDGCECMTMTEKAIKELEDYVGDVHKQTISFDAVTIARKALELQISMKKHCDSHDCADCRTNGMCARTFMLDELQ